MGASPKWVTGVSGDTPLRSAAAAILRVRLELVAERLERARDNPGDAVEIHQLRVATRRAAAALDALREALPGKPARRIRKRLKRIRRAAGAARDIDVNAAMLTRMRKRAPDEQKPVIDHLLRSLERRRGPAADAVAEAAERHGPKDIRRVGKALLKIDEGEEAGPTMLDAARATLSRLAADARAKGAGDLSSPEHLHELRISGKRLRYAMEVFACCFPPTLRESLYPRLEEAQEALGAVNDCDQMVTRLQAALHEVADDDGGTARAQVRAGLAALLGQFKRLRDDRAAGFAEWWESFQHDGFFEQLFATIGVSPPPEAPPCKAPAPPPAPETLHPEVPAAAIAAARPVASAAKRAAPEQLHARANGAHPREDGAMRLAAIDVGTNSIRLLVAEAYADGSYRILDDEKEVTRLGRGLATTGGLEPMAMQQSATAIARMKSIAEGYSAATIRIVGTCAVREASNGEDFLDMIRERAGATMEVLSAQEEAQLSHLSAAHAFDLRATPAVVADIGGGSTELILSAGGVIERIYTLSLGAVRLTEQFGGPEAAATTRFEEMRKWIKGSVKSVVEDPPFTPQMLIGAGGTFESLAKIAMQREVGAKPSGAPTTVRGYDMKRKDIKRLRDWLRETPLRERAKVPGLSPQRAEIIVAGAAIVNEVMKRLEVDRLRVHDGGIRDGLLLTMLAELGRGEGGGEGPRGRTKSVRQFAASCNYERRHCYHVTRLALQIFDQMASRRSGRPEPWMEPASRTLLEAASILHDVGYHINYSKHHLHSYHLIVHADLAGFSQREIEIIANIARYHRGSEPKGSHASYAALSKADRELVRKLGGILRLADGLDRTHMQNVRSVEMTIAGDEATLALDAERDPAVDVWGSERKSGLFASEFGLTPRYQWPAGTTIDTGNGADAAGAKTPEPEPEPAARRAKRMDGAGYG